jgi:hypothetical protein
MKLLYLCIIPCLLIAACEANTTYTSKHIKSNVIQGMDFDLDSIVTLAPGSDNWVVTWGQEGEQYTVWGDGGGFGGNNKRGRVSFGVARIDGAVDDFTTTNIWGGHQSLAPAQLTGKSYGILALRNTLWMWRTGNKSEHSAFESQELLVSNDKGRHWQASGVKFIRNDFNNSQPFFAPTFLQFGPGYKDSRDNYVYSYLPEVAEYTWDVQKPGEIGLMRVPRDAMNMRERYEFFSGIDASGQATWTTDIDQRSSVFSDINGIMRTSVTYNSGLRRYLLVTQQVSRFKKDGHIGIYEAPEPWGPWRTVLFDSPWKLGIQKGDKTVYWNFSNKWSSKDGKQFTMIYTGPSGDNFGVVQGRFLVKE